jgi:hypothetical protein
VGDAASGAVEGNDAGQKGTILAFGAAKRKDHLEGFAGRERRLPAIKNFGEGQRIVNRLPTPAFYLGRRRAGIFVPSLLYQKVCPVASASQQMTGTFSASRRNWSKVVLTAGPAARIPRSNVRCGQFIKLQEYSRLKQCFNVVTNCLRCNTIVS